MSNQAIMTALAIENPALSSYPLTLPTTQPLTHSAVPTGVRLKAKARCWNSWLTTLRRLTSSLPPSPSIARLQLPTQDHLPR